VVVVVVVVVAMLALRVHCASANLQLWRIRGKLPSNGESCPLRQETGKTLLTPRLANHGLLV